MSALPSPSVWVLDLDGTLLGPDHALHPHTIDVLAEAHARGIRVVVATGRILASARRVLAPLPFEPWCICCGGQTVIGPGEPPTIDAPLDVACVADVLQRAVGVDDVAVHLYSADDQAMWRPNDAGRFLADSESITYRELDALPEPVPADLAKIVLAASAEVARALDARFEGSLDYGYVATGARFRDVLPRHVDKGTALDRLLARTGWPADGVLSAGDHDNDLPTFARATWRLAVGERCPALVSQATERVESNADAGLARVLARWLR